jgi:uroporphyrinogen decarboxylase
MKHRERVETALNHEVPDRCPMQISFTPEFADRLRKEIGSELINVHNPHGGGNTYELERYLDEDMLLTSVGWANNYYKTIEPGAEYIDNWGVGWKAIQYQTKFGQGVYTELMTHPLADCKDLKDLDDYQSPDPNEPEMYVDAQQTIANYKDQYWIVGVTVTTIWETAWALRGLEQLLMDLVINPELANKILDIPFKYHLTAAKKLVELGVDMIWIGDDVGSQQGMIMAPDMWRTFLKPRMLEFVATIKGINPNLKVAYHCDGNLYPIINDLIEVGIDVLNPIQPACMDPAELKREFGDRLCFWGTIDEQHTLPFGSPEDVKNEIELRINTVGKDGGLILGPTHHVQLDTPMENFWAIIQTISDIPYPN